MKKQPLVSIGLPVYNGERFLPQALDSLLAQDYKNFELIISDNASIDRTREICLYYQGSDKRFWYQRSKENRGSTWNFNQVFKLSSGDYFMWAAHDDYWKPTYISSCLKAFKLSKDIVLAGTICELIDPKTKKLMLIDEGFSTVGFNPSERFKRYRSILYSGKHVGGIFCGLYKRQVLRKLMPFMKVLAADNLLLGELCLEGEMVTVPKKLMVKRWGGLSKSFKSAAKGMGINNPFLIKCPWFIREIFMQKIIFTSDKLTWLEKIKLASWSFMDYFVLGLRK